MMDPDVAGAGWRRYLAESSRISRRAEERRRAAVRLADAVAELVEAAMRDGMDGEDVREVLETVGRRVG